MWCAFQSELSWLFAFSEETCDLHLFSWRPKISLGLVKNPSLKGWRKSCSCHSLERCRHLMDTPGALPLSPGRIFQPLLGSALPSIGWCCPHSITPLQTLYIKSSQLLLLPESLGRVCCVVLTLCCSLILSPFLLVQHSLRCSITGVARIYKASRWKNFWCPISQNTEF